MTKEVVSKNMKTLFLQILSWFLRGRMLMLAKSNRNFETESFWLVSFFIKKLKAYGNHISSKLIHEGYTTLEMR